MTHPSEWVRRWLAGLAAGATLLDLAAGGGRHARLAASLGLRVTAIDRDAAAMGGLAAAGIEALAADLEADDWPLAGRHFDAVVCTNYLFRPRLPDLFASVADGGRLVYETFAAGNERHGRPANPDFLLREGELIDAARVAGLRVVAYEHGLATGPKAAVVQRLCAVRGLDPAFVPLESPPGALG